MGFVQKCNFLREGLTVHVQEKVTFTLRLPFIIKIIHMPPKTELHIPQCAEVGR